MQRWTAQNSVCDTPTLFKTTKSHPTHRVPPKCLYGTQGRLHTLIWTNNDKKKQREPTIILANGRIRCRRCQALSKRSRNQCRKPALKGKWVCDFHGGKSTGPKTQAGRQRIASAKTVHGKETRAKRRERTESDARMRNFEDLLHVLGMTSAPRWKGRKPTGYVPITTAEQAKVWIAADILGLHR